MITKAEFRSSENGPAITSAEHGASGGLYIEYDLDAKGYKDGDTFTYALPDNFATSAPSNTMFTFVATYNGTDYQIGTATYSFGRLRVVLNEGVEQLDGIRGHFWIGGNYLGTPDDPDMTLNPGTDHEYTIRITFAGDLGNPGGGSPQEHGKYAWFKEGSNNSVLLYSVRLNMDKARVFVAGSTITDRANGLVVNPATLVVQTIAPSAVLAAGVDYTVDFFADGSGFSVTLLTDVDQEFWLNYESSVFQVADAYRNDVTAVIPGKPDGGDAFGQEVKWADISSSSQGYLRDLTLVKKDQDTNQPLSGAVFDLYRTIDGSDRLVRSGLTTGDDGKLVASGLLSGEYKLVEVSLPSGYGYVDGKESVSVTLQPGQTNNIEIDFYNQKEETPVVPGAVELNKVDPTNVPLEGAEFTIYDHLNAIHDSQVTDASGYARFSGLVPGFYTVKETKAPNGFVASEAALAGYQVSVVSGETTKVKGSGSNGAIVNERTPAAVEPSLKTTATNKADGSKNMLYVGGTITDTVSYTGLTAGKQYKLVGQLMDKSTGRIIPGTSTNTMFTASAANGEQALDLTLPRGYAGKSIVVYEYLYEANGTTLVAEHTEIGDAGQTVTVNPGPTIGTTATNKAGGSHALTSDGGVIVDVVRYTGLIPGIKYTLRGELMDKATGQTSGITSSDLQFTPTSADGTISVEFIVDASLAGTTLVAYEWLYQGSSLEAQHTDIDSVEQSVGVNANPTVATTATNKDTNDKTPLRFFGGVVVDEVRYTGLNPGEPYTITGELMHKELNETTGESTAIATGITSAITFQPEAADGSVSLEFVVDGAYANGMLVAFERLYDVNGKLIAQHEDVESTEQTITVGEVPALRTTATNKDDAEQPLEFQGGTITDLVEYTNLVPGVEHTLKGELIDKATGKPTGVTAERTFVPETANGSIGLDFTVPSGFAGKRLVVFETVVENERVIATHRDIDSEEQTVDIRPEPTVTTSAADKADADQQLTENGGTIVDTVYYRGLIPGREYTLQGELRYKENGDRTGLSATRTFVPETADGAVDLELTVPTGYKDTWVVVFETVLDGDLVVAQHKDIDSEAQSIFVDHTPGILAFTGSTIMAPLCGSGLVLVLGSALFTAVLIRNRRAQERGAEATHSPSRGLVV
ncbi:VaFE repeat-containing surface-anchored protein [Diaminobutyricibacter tongyongensis]|uniref:VaFE repeat-containing surface-anchored protein n=1 Tax=Leifsonia tongyongensis TaxID=1268043 RepID=A0A6L9XWJ5_9MICO|nr:VaFE repeat-containing surface-anchored protein [Diaminobutyricibacter tongyongensis]NEN05743.1 VaFE repeat-containing surface-anchored protein [Diaminobutyricibacter tongyongensis]